MRARIFALLLLGLLSLSLAANPVITYNGLLRVWFDDAEDFWMEYFPVIYSPTVTEDLRELAFYTSAGGYSLPDDFVHPPLTGFATFQVNLSQSVPGFSIDRQSDVFGILNSPYDTPPLRWGMNSGYPVNLRPLEEGQFAHLQPATDWQFQLQYVWTKNEVESLQDFASTAKVSVRVTDDQGHPVQNFPVRNYLGNPLDNIFWLRQTGADGVCTFDGWPMLYQIHLEDPVDDTVVGDYDLYPEPGDSLFLPVTVDCHHGEQTQAGTLALRPNLLRGSASTLNVSYDYYWQLEPGSQLALHDLRGRKLAIRDFPLSGQLDWTLPEISNGIYFITLRSGGKVLDSQRLTFLK